MIIICEWPDGTWCYEDEVEGYIQWMGDDYTTHGISEEELEENYL